MFLSRSLGSAIGISFSGIILQHFLRDGLREALKDGEGADRIIRHVLQSLEYTRKLDGKLQDIVEATYNDAIRMTILFQLCLFGGSLLAVVWIREKSLGC